MRKKLVLIDGHAIIYRAYHAMPHMTYNGEKVGAVYGFVSMLLRVVNEISPTHLIVCFDLPQPTFRRELYMAYQSKRPPSDVEMRDQLEVVKDLVVHGGIPIYTAVGFEADDVIGTLSTQAIERGIDEVVIVTGDRDIMQLVTDKVTVFAPIKGVVNAKLFGPSDVCEYVGVLPEKIVDFKALIGDSSDNYPGVPGIGPKTALGLLENYGSVDGIYRKLAEEGGNLEGVSGGVCSKLVTGEESARLSYQLATIRRDVPIELDMDRAKVPTLTQKQEFMEKMQSLGFRSLIGRINGRIQIKTDVKKVVSTKGEQMGLL